MSSVSRMARLLWFRPTSWLQAIAYSLVMFVLVLGVGLVAGRPQGWLLTAVATSFGMLLAGLLHVASRPD